MSRWSRVGVVLAFAVLPFLNAAPVEADHAVANYVYAEPSGEVAKPIIHYVELADAASGGRVRIFMGDGHVVCLNGPVGFAMAPATQSGYVAFEWRGCNPYDPVATFTYRVERRGSFDNQPGIAVGVADAFFTYDYGAPGVYQVDWRAGTEEFPAAGRSVVVAV